MVLDNIDMLSDVTNMPEFKGEEFDVIVDKGTYDALVVRIFAIFVNLVSNLIAAWRRKGRNWTQNVARSLKST